MFIVELVAVVYRDCWTLTKATQLNINEPNLT
jgi:hypothetical protein